ncbi:MAG: TasA family protein [Candidatus Limivicinus sp.]|nr:TasA family protein [Candidatus Limivicinus sp.]
MKKKIVALCLCVALAVVAIGGATLAYFTDTDEATNTFTAGGVKIDLIEQQVNKDGTALEDFEQNQVLMPIVGSAQGAKDQFGQPVAENYIDKIVTIENTGKSDAYVRAYFAIPSALDDGYETFNAGANILHFNFGNENGVSTEGVQWSWMHGNKWNYFETTIDGVAYNVYFADYYQVLPAGETTEQFLSGVYLDKSFDMKDGKYYAFGKEVDLSGLINADGELAIKCPVKAVAVQAAGFGSVDAAITEAFGAQFNPFGGTVTNWQ